MKCKVQRVDSFSSMQSKLLKILTWWDSCVWTLWKTSMRHKKTASVVEDVFNTKNMTATFIYVAWLRVHGSNIYILLSEFYTHSSCLCETLRYFHTKPLILSFNIFSGLGLTICSGCIFHLYYTVKKNNNQQIKGRNRSNVSLRSFSFIIVCKICRILI